MEKIRTTKQVLEDIKKRINTKGYIYALCMILFDDFHIIPEEIHKTDTKSRLL
jgi:hypothetical protein